MSHFADSQNPSNMCPESDARTDDLRNKQLIAGIRSYERCVREHNEKIDLQIQSMKNFKSMYFAFRSEFCAGAGPIEIYGHTQLLLR